MLLSKTVRGKILTMWLAGVVLLGETITAAAAELETQTVTQWYPYAEWIVTDVQYEANPFDVIAWAYFEHSDSGESIRTGMFYAGDNTWKFRFTGIRTGEWTFTTASDDAPALDDLRGKVEVESNENPTTSRGFVAADRHQWVWSGSGRAFTPQYAMAAHPKVYYDDPDRIQQDLELWYDEHGFNGVHTQVFMRWYDIDIERRDGGIADNPNPDFRTFEGLEALITASYEAGGVVHLWQWGDEDRTMTPIGLVGGINGEPDLRLQRYIAARLGPLPGWTLGYGFDLWEWVDEDALRIWHEHMHEQMGWPHLLGGRAHKHRLTQIYEGLDYSSYEDHRSDYARYVEKIEARPDKPTFSEDRFRVRVEQRSRWPEKDYTPELVRRGLWHSMMAGGVANIWGYEPSGADRASQPFPNAEHIRTYAAFHDRYFDRDMVRDNDRTNGVCLRAKDKSLLIFYWEDQQLLQQEMAVVAETLGGPTFSPVGGESVDNAVRMDLRGIEGPLVAVAVNSIKPYEEIEVEVQAGQIVNWQPSEPGDWAIAVLRK